MSGKKIWIVAAVGALAVLLVPLLFPTGPDAGLDAAQFLSNGRFAVGALVVFAGGLLTAMTPCVYPLIPITVSVFGARKAESRGKAVLLTSSYVVGMGAVFSALGMIAAKTGQAFGSALGNPWVVGGLAVFLLVLASSMFGAFELAVPSGLQQKLNTVGGAGLLGAFLMGTVSGFLAAPCTGPVLTGLLAFVAKSQSTALGAGLLFIYALGVGAPFFVVGAFSFKLPRGGVWMEWVKSVLGVMLVALAATYLKDAWPALHGGVEKLGDALGRWPGAGIAAVVTFLGISMGAIHKSFKENRADAVVKGVAVVLVTAAILLRGAAMNTHDAGELWVKAGWAKPAEAPVLAWHAKLPQPGGSLELPQFEKVLATARSSGKPVMIDFFAEWCAACKELDRETYVAPSVVEESNRFITIKVDATNDDDSIEELFKRFDIQGLPTVAFVSSGGEVLKAPRVTGFLGPEKFVAEMNKVR